MKCAKMSFCLQYKLKVGDADVLDDERDSDDDATEQIGRCNLPGRSRSNRIITAPARFYDYF